MNGKTLALKSIVATPLLLCTAVFAQQIPAEPPPELEAFVAEAVAAAESGGSGPFRAEMRSEPTLRTHTIYRPSDLEAAAGSGGLPIVAWGNGSCANYGNRYRYFLTEIASHGYVVIAIGPVGPSGVEWAASTPLPEAGPEGREPMSYASQLTDAIDWAIAENARSGSEYEGTLDPSRIAVMGMSCGGLQAISAAADPRVGTLMVWNSGTFPEGTAGQASTGGATKASLTKLHTPVAYIGGDQSDIAFENSNADFAAISHLPVFRAWLKGVPHAGTYRQPRGGEFSHVAVAWLDWQLKGRREAGRMFRGEDCGLCRDRAWVVSKKKID